VIDTTHIIQAQEYQIDLQDEQEAYALQSNISSLQESQINEVLNRVLNAHNNEEAIYQFDVIELDLGTVSKVNYKNEIVYRLEEELAKYLSYAIRENGQLRSGKNISLQDKRIEALAHFFEKGRFEWNTDRHIAPEKLLEELLQTPNTALSVMLKRVGKTQQARKRMIYQLNDTLLTQIVVLVAKKEGEYIITYKDEIIKQQKKKPIVKTTQSGFKNAVWEILLAYLFIDSKGYYDKKSFLSLLIKKVAVKYNLAFQSLIKTLSRTITQDKKFSSQHIEFKSILIELTQEDRAQRIEKPIRPELEKEDTNKFLKQLSYYIAHGVFDTTVEIRSKRAFNAHFLKILKRKDAQVLFYLDQWLADYSKKERLLGIASKTVLEQILETTNNIAVKSCKKFMTSIAKHRATFSDDTLIIYDQIKQQSVPLIFSIVLSPLVLERVIVQSLLKIIWHTVRTSPEAYIQFLQEIRKHLSPIHKKTLDQFVKTFDQHREAVVLEQISNEIQRYTQYRNRSFWSSWLEDKMPLWIAQTKKTPKELLAFIQSDSKTKNASIALQQFLRDYGQSETVNDTIQNEVTTVLPVEESVKRERQTLVEYVLTHGKFPWWIKEHYSWSSFNADYTEIWKSSSGRKKTLNILEKNIDQISYARLLEDYNLFELWKELDVSTGKNHSGLLIALSQYIREQLLPIGISTTFKYYQYKERALKYLMKGTFTKKPEVIFQFLKAWSDDTQVYKEAAVFELYTAILEKYLVATAVYDQFKIWKDTIVDKQGIVIPSRQTTLEAYIQAHIPVEKHNLPIWDQLQERIKISPKQFEILIQQATFRTSIGTTLSPADIEQLIFMQINVQQQKLYKEALQHLGEYRAYISAQEYAKAMEIFNELLLLKLSTRKINRWGLSHWNHVIFYVLNKAVGTKKNKRIINKICERLTIDSKTSHKTNQNIVGQWQGWTTKNIKASEPQEKESVVKEFSNPILQIVEPPADLKTNEIEHTLGQYLTVRQRSYYWQIISYVESYMGTSLSVKESKKLNVFFLQLAVIQLNKGDIRYWKLKEWSQLLWYSVKTTFGEKKSQAILKQAKEREAIYKRNQKLTLQLQQLVNSKEEIQYIKKSPSVEKTRVQLAEETIEQQLTSNQKFYYRQTLDHLQLYAYFLSIKEIKAIKEDFLFRLGEIVQSNAVQTWSIKEWAKLLVDSIHQVIEVQKNKDIISAIKKDRKTHEIYTNQLRELVTGNPDYKITKVIVESQDVIEEASEDITATSIDQIHKKIVQKITTTQLSFYKKTIHFIDTYASYISLKDYKDLKELILKYIAIVLQKNTLRVWKWEDWIENIFYFSHQVLGDKKYRRSMERFRESIQNQTGGTATINLRFFNQLHKIATKEPQGILKQTKKNMDESEEDYKKLGAEVPHEFIDPIFITNAGVIILAPYLAMLFQKCGLMENSKFIDLTSVHKAVYVLSYAVTGDIEQTEHEMVMYKVLCGLPINAPLLGTIQLEDSEKSIVEGLLTAVIQHWTILGDTTIDGLRTSFLQREGKLEEEEERFFLKIENKSYDMLLDQIPWNISKISLSWMYKLMNVEWRP